MLLIDEMLAALRREGALGLCAVTYGGAWFVGPVATTADAGRLARKTGSAMHSMVRKDARFVLHRRAGNGTAVVARFDSDGREVAE